MGFLASLQTDLFAPKARALVGLDISSSSVKMVELAQVAGGGYRLERYVIEPLSREAVSEGNINNLELAAEAVQRAWKRLGTTVRNVAMALPASAVITKKIVVAADLREDELELQVESEANQYIPFALDEVNLDFQVLGPLSGGPDEVEVLIAASRKEKVEDRVAVAEGAGLKPVVMDVESYAAQAAFHLLCQQLPEGGRDKTLALVDIGAHVTHLTVLRNEQTLYSREQAFGGDQLTEDMTSRYGMTPEEAETAKRSREWPDGCVEELVQPFLESMGLEIARALQFFFTSTQYNHIDAIVLAGGCVQLDGAVAAVAGRTQIHTLLANPFAGMAVADRVRQKSLQTESPSLMVACGLALRRFDT